MALETTRFPGDNQANILTQSNTRMRDMIATRCQIGTLNDKDNGLPVSIALSSPIGQCTTASATADKVVTISNFNDFELQPGIEISVYFANANTANNPTLNVGGTGAIPISVQGQASNVSVGAGCFKTGIYNLKYIDITVSGTRIQQWLLLNGGIAEQTSDYTKYGDGTIVYSSRYTEFRIEESKHVSGRNTPDLNNILETGCFYCLEANNSPYGTYGFLECYVRPDTTDYGYQTWTPYNTNSKYIRIRNDGVWTEWKQVQLV